jgi:hypothetical protein
VALDCLSAPLSGWQSVGSSNYEYTRVDITVQNGPGAGVGVNGCDNGVHEMHSDEPFGVTVWGWDTAVSYAYPAGAKVEFINNVDAGVNQGRGRPATLGTAGRRGDRPWPSRVGRRGRGRRPLRPRDDERPAVRAACA